MRPRTHQYDFADGHFYDALNNGQPMDDEPEDHWRIDTWPCLILIDAAGFCGCVDEIDKLADMMAHYLRGGFGTYTGGPGPFNVVDPTLPPILHYDHDDLASCLVAWIADAASFTEHGGNVGGSWIRPEGIRWLELYDRDGTERADG